MRSKNEELIFKTAIETFGETNQLHMLLEEMSELQKEVCKAMRFTKKMYRKKVAEEIADVEIMIEQVKMIFNVDEDVEGWRLDKTVRLAERLGAIPDYRGGEDH